MLSLQWHFKYSCQLFVKIQSLRPPGGGYLPEKKTSCHIHDSMNYCKTGAMNQGKSLIFG